MSTLRPDNKINLPPKHIDLTPQDWLWVTYQPHEILQHTPARPFDLQQALAQLAKIQSTPYGWGWQWENIDIPNSLNRQEAHFWFSAMTALSEIELTQPKQSNREELLLAKMKSLPPHTFSGEISLSQAGERLAISSRTISSTIMLPLRSLFSAEDLIELAVDEVLISTNSIMKGSPRSIGTQHQAQLRRESIIDALVNGFRIHILPTLSPTELTACRQQAKPHLEYAIWPDTPFKKLPAILHLAAVLGLHEKLEELIKDLPNDFYKRDYDYYQRPQEIIFALNRADKVEDHMRRLKLKLRKPAYIRAWLAHTNLSALDLIQDSIQNAPDKKTAQQMMEAFSIVKASEAAPHMLALMLQNKTDQEGRCWLEDHPQHAVLGLTPLAAGSSRLAQAALRFLRKMSHQGHTDLIQFAVHELDKNLAEQKAAQRYQLSLWQEEENLQENTAKTLFDKIFNQAAANTPPLDENSTPDWLHACMLPLSAAEDITQPEPTSSAPKESATALADTLPDWLHPDDLPPLPVNNSRLNHDQVSYLLSILQQSDLETPHHPIIEALKTNIDSRELENFVWELLEIWLQEGAPPKHKWAMIAVGLLGSNTCALKLAAYIRNWPGESQHQRAVLGLSCLEAIGSDTALMQISSIAHSLKYKGLKNKARQAIEAIAQQRQLTPEQLEDRIIPDCSLDPSGGRIFDYGSRCFTFMLSPTMKPRLRTESGKLLKNLPQPNNRDNPKLAKQALHDWKLLKKQVRQVAISQADRLEQALIASRCWPVDEFQALLIAHPLMINLVRLLLWTARDENRNRLDDFRVTEDSTLADLHENTYHYPKNTAYISLLHPLDLSEKEKLTWAKILSDYEIIPPFPQLNRNTFTLLEDEKNKLEVTRFNDQKIPAALLVSNLQKNGWLRDTPAEDGLFHEHIRQFRHHNITAVLRHTGITAGRTLYESPDQNLLSTTFVEGIYTPSQNQPTQLLPLQEVPEIVFSETLRDLYNLYRKAVKL